MNPSSVIGNALLQVRRNANVEDRSVAIRHDVDGTVHDGERTSHAVTLNEAPLLAVILSEAAFFAVILSEAPRAPSRRQYEGASPCPELLPFWFHNLGNTGREQPHE